MGKHEPGSLKALNKSMKAKGLQKLKFYCQVCEKQCRDESGFQSHTKSETHVRKMLLFASNSKRYLDAYSQQFEKGYIDILSRRHNTKRMNANQVYNEYIQDKEHIHMNATIWTTLSQFVQHLGKEGICIVDEDERGLYVQWVDKDNPKRKAQEEAQKKKRAHDEDDEDRHHKLIKRQIKAAQAKANGEGLGIMLRPEELTKEDLEKSSITVSLGSSKRGLGKRPQEQSIKAGEWEAESDDDTKPSVAISKYPVQQSMVAKLAQQDAGRQTGEVRQEPVSLFPNTWLASNLIVRVMTSKAGEGLKKRKGRIKSVECNLASARTPCAVLEMNDASLGCPKVKASYLETVIPDLGGDVLIVADSASFPHRGMRAKLVNIDIKRFLATVRLPDGSEEKLNYENICKLAGGHNTISSNT